MQLPDPGKKWISQLSVILAGQAFSLMGSGIVQFAIIWWLASRNEPIYLATATIMGVLPVILFSPIAGVVADRYNRKHVMILADGAIACVTAVFFILLRLGGISTGLVLLLLFLRATGTAFHQPTFEAAMPAIVPQKQLVRIAAITQMLRSGVSLVAPMLGAVLYGVMRLEAILLIDVGTAAIAIVSLALVRLPQLAGHGKDAATFASIMTDFRMGIGYVWKWRGLRSLIIMFALANFLLAPVLAMIPQVISHHFSGAEKTYAFFEMALAIGLIFGSLSLSVWGGTRRKIVIVNVAQVLCGLFIASIAFIPDVVLIPGKQIAYLLAAAALIGVSSAFVNSPVMAILQSCVDKEMLGRVMSVGSTICSLAMPLSLIITGPVANKLLDSGLSLLPIIWVPGLLSTLLGVVCFLLPELMRIEARRPVQAAESQSPGQDQPAADHPHNGAAQTLVNFNND